MMHGEPPIYLDHHATTPVDPRVLSAMLPYFSERFGNAASVNHAYGTEAAEAAARARAQVADLLGTLPETVIFTSGATEANNLALKGVLRAAPGRQRHLVVTAAEHRSVLDPARSLAREGVDVTVVPVDRHGRVELSQLETALRPETCLVSTIWANNEVGTINPMAELAALCRARGVPWHADASQAAGRIPVDLSAELQPDLVSVTAHKLYGPKGIGALIVRPGGPRLRPLFEGGGHERGLRSGTLPVPLVVGFGSCCALARDELPAEAERLAKLRDRLWLRLVWSLDKILPNGHPTERLPGNLNVTFEGVNGELLMKSVRRVACSSGSACSTADPEPSHVLRAMGRTEAQSRASLRFGIGRSTTAEEVDEAADHLIDVVRRLRRR